MREDILAAPLFALSFKNGASVAVLDPAPRGDTTVEETRLATPVMTDARFQFGALGAWQADKGPIEFGFSFPGSSRSAGGRGGGGGAQGRFAAITRSRPARRTATKCAFASEQNESFRDVTRNAWRWAWSILNPPITYLDVDQMRRVLIDHLAAQAATIDGRTAIPFVESTIVDQHQWN